MMCLLPDPRTCFYNEWVVWDPYRRAEVRYQKCVAFEGTPDEMLIWVETRNPSQPQAPATPDDAAGVRHVGPYKRRGGPSAP